MNKGFPYKKKSDFLIRAKLTRPPPLFVSLEMFEELLFGLISSRQKFQFDCLKKYFCCKFVFLHKKTNWFFFFFFHLITSFCQCFYTIWFLCLNFFVGTLVFCHNFSCKPIFCHNFFLVTTVTTIIVEFQILLLYSSKGNFFTNSHDTLHILCLHHHHVQLQAIMQKYDFCAFCWSFNWNMIKLANLVYCQIDILSLHLIFMNVNPAKNIPEFLGDNSDSWVLSQRFNATLL